MADPSLPPKRLRNTSRRWNHVTWAAALAGLFAAAPARAALPPDGQFDVGILNIPSPDAAFWQNINLGPVMRTAPGVTPWTLSYVPPANITAPALLPSLDVLVVPGIDRSWLTPARSAAIVSFVQNGGVLLLAPVQPTATGAEPLATAFGTTYGLTWAATNNPTSGCTGPGTAWPFKNLHRIDLTSPFVTLPNFVDSVFLDCDFVRPVSPGTAWRIVASSDEFAINNPAFSAEHYELLAAPAGEGVVLAASTAFSHNTLQHKKLAENLIWAAHVFAPDTVAPDVTMNPMPVATSDPQLFVSGTVSDAGTVISAEILVDGAIAIGSAQLGTISVSGTVTLTEGLHTISIRAIDTSGNAGVAQALVRLDTTAPVIAIDPAPALTNSPTLTVAGSVLDNGSGIAAASVFVNGALAASPVPAADGTVAADVRLDEGLNTIELRGTDLSGNAAGSHVVVTLDTAPPNVQILSVPAVTSMTTLAVRGSVDDANGIASANLVLNGTDLGPLTPDDDGLVNASVQLAEGPSSLVLVAVDRAGNVASQQVDVVVDTTLPTITILSPTPGQALGSSTFGVTVQLDDATATTLDIAGQTFVVPAGGGSVTASVTLPVEGASTVLVTATDEAGNTSASTVDVVLDLGAPVVSLDLADGARLGPQPGDLVLLTLHIDDLTATTVSVGGTTQTLAPGGGVVAFALPLVEGGNDLTITVQDETGLSTVLTRSVTYDTSGPTGSITVPGAGHVVRGTVDMSAVVADALTGVTSVSFEVDGGAAFFAELSATGVWLAPFDSTTLADGSHAVIATATDGVGNTTALSSTFQVDNTAPILSLTAPAAGAYVSGTLTLQANASDALSGVSDVSLFVNGTLVGACASSPCAVAFDTTTLPDGAFQLSATALDLAGNSAAVVERTVSADNSAPTRFLTSPAAGSLVKGTMTVAVSVVDASFASVECFVGGASLGVSTSPTFTSQVSVTGQLDGALVVTCLAKDQAGNVGTETTTVTVQNTTVSLNPQTLNLKSKGGSTSITLIIEGANVSTLIPSAGFGWALLVPGGSPVPATPFSASDKVGDEDKDGIPDLTLKFDRTALIASLQGGIASGRIDTSQPVTVQLLAKGRVFGSDSILVK